MPWPARLRNLTRLLPEGLQARLPAGLRVDEEEERVQFLWRNRAELKKSFSNSLDEVQRLKDRVKQQEGATARVQELLQDLETRLSRPDSAWPATVFYHLRELWSLGRGLVQQFISDLEAQQAERERRAAFAEFNRRQFGRKQEVESACLAATSEVAQARGRVQQLEEQLAAQQKPWHYFKRRHTRQELQAANTRGLLAEQALAEAQAARDAVEAERIEYAGLSLEARRAINVAALGYAQLLRERLEASGLYELARRASERREPPDGEYGDRRGCEQLLVRIAAVRSQLEQRDGILPEIRKRADALRASARYRASSDVLPTGESLNAAANAGTRVLLEDTWEIHRDLLA